jgi:hypothetical protein
MPINLLVIIITLKVYNSGAITMFLHSNKMFMFIEDASLYYNNLKIIYWLAISQAYVTPTVAIFSLGTVKGKVAPVLF